MADVGIKDQKVMYFFPKYNDLVTREMDNTLQIKGQSIV
jgi:hypothetical protein